MPCFGRIIVIKRSGADGSCFPMTSNEVVIGRDETCDIRVQLPNVSVKHCSIKIDGKNEATLTNLSDKNPTLICGKVLLESTKLKHGDVFTIIDRSFRFDAPLKDRPVEFKRKSFVIDNYNEKNRNFLNGGGDCVNLVNSAVTPAKKVMKLYNDVVPTPKAAGFSRRPPSPKAAAVISCPLTPKGVVVSRPPTPPKSAMTTRTPAPKGSKTTHFAKTPRVDRFIAKTPLSIASKPPTPRFRSTLNTNLDRKADTPRAVVMSFSKPAVSVNSMLSKAKPSSSSDLRLKQLSVTPSRNKFTDVLTKREPPVFVPISKTSSVSNAIPRGANIASSKARISVTPKLYSVTEASEKSIRSSLVRSSKSIERSNEKNVDTMRNSISAPLDVAVPFVAISLPPLHTVLNVLPVEKPNESIITLPDVIEEHKLQIREQNTPTFSDAPDLSNENGAMLNVSPFEEISSAEEEHLSISELNRKHSLEVDVTSSNDEQSKEVLSFASPRVISKSAQKKKQEVQIRRRSVPLAKPQDILSNRVRNREQNSPILNGNLRTLFREKRRSLSRSESKVKEVASPNYSGISELFVETDVTSGKASKFGCASALRVVSKSAQIKKQKIQIRRRSVPLTNPQDISSSRLRKREQNSPILNGNLRTLFRENRRSLSRGESKVNEVASPNYSGISELFVETDVTSGKASKFVCASALRVVSKSAQIKKQKVQVRRRSVPLANPLDILSSRLRKREQNSPILNGNLRTLFREKRRSLSRSESKVKEVASPNYSGISELFVETDVTSGKASKFVCASALRVVSKSAQIKKQKVQVRRRSVPLANPQDILSSRLRKREQNSPILNGNLRTLFREKRRSLSRGESKVNEVASPNYSGISDLFVETGVTSGKVSRRQDNQTKPIDENAESLAAVAFENTAVEKNVRIRRPSLPLAKLQEIWSSRLRNRKAQDLERTAQHVALPKRVTRKRNIDVESEKEIVAAATLQPDLYPPKRTSSRKAEDFERTAQNVALPKRVTRKRNIDIEPQKEIIAAATLQPDLYPSKRTSSRKAEDFERTAQNVALPKRVTRKRNIDVEPQNEIIAAATLQPDLNPPKRTNSRKAEDFERTAQHVALPKRVTRKRNIDVEPQKEIVAAATLQPDLYPPKRTSSRKAEDLERTAQHVALPKRVTRKRNIDVEPQKEIVAAATLQPDLNPPKRTSSRKAEDFERTAQNVALPKRVTRKRNIDVEPQKEIVAAATLQPDLNPPKRTRKTRARQV